MVARIGRDPHGRSEGHALRRAPTLLAAVLASLGLGLSNAASIEETELVPPPKSDAGEVTLTTEEAVAEALGKNLRLQSLDSRAEVQALRARSADWLDNPEFRVRNLSTRRRAGRFDELEIGVRWRPPTLGEAKARGGRNEVRFWERRAEASRARTWLASRVRRACADVIMHRELMLIDSARVENETRRIAQIETMVELGRRSIVYYTKAKMAVTEARRMHSQDLQALKEERRRLQRLTGISSKIRVTTQPLPEIDVDDKDLLALAFEHRPEVHLVEARKQLAVDRFALERKRLLPWPSFVEVSRHIERGGADWHELTFGMEFPVFNRNADGLAASRLGISQHDLESQAMRERIEDEVHDSYSEYNEAMLAWDLARVEGEAIVRDASTVIADAVRHRTVPADEILELERTIMDARVAIVEKRRELAHALYFLYYAVGFDGPGLSRAGDGN